jgi:methionine-rich copper-binding protein CopC
MRNRAITDATRYAASMASSLARIALLVSGSICAALVAPSLAGAHGNVLETMQPADGSTVTAPIEQVVLVYSQPPGIERVEVITPGGVSREVRTQQRGVRIVVPFTPDETGRWTLRWKVIQTDGHAIEYERTLNVAQSAVPRTAADDVLDALVDTWARMLERLAAFP